MVAQERHRVGDFRDAAEASEREAGRQLAPAALVADLLLRTRFPAHDLAVGFDRPRVDADNAHAVIGAFAAERARHCHQARIAHGAGHVLRAMPFARQADDIDDHAAFAFAHAAIDLAREIDEAPHFQVPRFAPGFLIEGRDRALRNRARIVDEEVDRPGGIRKFRHVLGFAEIERVHGDVDLVLGSEIVFRRGERLRAAGSEMQIDAFGGQRFGDAVADAARAASNERGASFEVEFHGCEPENDWMGGCYYR